MQSAGPDECTKCGRKVDADWRLCPSCATPLNGATRTVIAPPAPASSSSADIEGRFPAGTVLAGRYRILGLLGRGGMGEVYRAHDLILDQMVALKFLPRADVSEAALARFRNEVRIARQVSHPNVCRVYDIGSPSVISAAGHRPTCRRSRNRSAILARRADRSDAPPVGRDP